MALHSHLHFAKSYELNSILACNAQHELPSFAYWGMYFFNIACLVGQSSPSYSLLQASLVFIGCWGQGDKGLASLFQGWHEMAGRQISCCSNCSQQRHPGLRARQEYCLKNCRSCWIFGGKGRQLGPGVIYPPKQFAHDKLE